MDKKSNTQTLNLRDTNKKVFMLIDGSAILHRAFHSMPASFASSDGKPTGAIYGFSSMLLKLIQNIKPDYISVAFDRSAPTFRQEMYVEYHANRPEAPENLKVQFSSIRELLAEIGIPVYEIDGFEADDIIGTINSTINKEHDDIVVYVVTGDRDLLQLVDEDTHVIMPVKGISEVMLYTPERVEKKFGIRPDQIIDLKAFMGDSSDNYPGVPGVGPKTAMQLLQKYDHFEAVFENISKIEQENPKLAKKLADGADQAQLAKKLAALDCNVPIAFNIEDSNSTNFPKDNFKKAFSKYEFNSLIKRLEDTFDNDSNHKNQMKLI